MKFYIYLDQAYNQVGQVLLDSLHAFSKHEVRVTSINFDFVHSHPGLQVTRINTRDRINYAENLRVSLIAGIQEPGIVLDADSIANWNVDELFDLCELNFPLIQPLAPCGYLNEKDVPELRLKAPAMHFNCVPMILTRNSYQWIQRALSLIEKFKEIHKKIYQGNFIADDVIWDWLRHVTQETCHCNSCSVDRTEFPLYCGTWQDALHVSHQGVYQGRYVSFQMFHGEKDPSKARSMLEKLKTLGQDFQRNCPIRSRLPKVCEKFQG
jgi:hypothetical protein